MAGLRECRRALVLCVGVALTLPTAAAAQTPAPTPAPTAPATPPATPAPTVPVGPAPFDMPMDTGPKMVAQAAQARLDLAAAEPQLASAAAVRDEQQQRWDQLTAHLVSLDTLRSQTIAELTAAKARLGASAAHAYMSSGGGRLNAALEAMDEAGDLLDFSRDMHLIASYGQHEIDIVDALERQKRAFDREILQVSRQRAQVKTELEAAVLHLTTLTEQVADAQRRLIEADTQIARFHELASTAGSPIMGPNRLTAPQLAAFIRNNGYTPNITVTIDELAQYYIEESEKLGIRGDVAFAQSILETGGFNFSGSMVEIQDNNYAGIGACDSCNRGFLFPDARHGVRAQMQLLRVYVDPTVTIDSLPDPLLLPGTLRLGFRGKVQSWWDLTGTWATATDYGIRVYDLYLRIVAEAEAAEAAAAAAAAALPATPPAEPAPAP
jgi:Mannosyl-glycoprotein endo-beta-N-acetylglucosaminidase